jgi:hypothetical protein
MTRITLDLESGMPVEGRVVPEDGAVRSFTGYAGLIAALEAIRVANGGQRTVETGDGKGDERSEARRIT